MKISLVQLRLLEAVAETGSVGAAARRLRLTQSGASQAIATLEKILGVEVLARKRDGAALTAFGQSILADAKAALQAIDRIEVQARCRASGAPERLRVAAIPSQLQYVLPGLRKTFQRLYPGIEFSAFEGGHDDVSLWVRDGIADLGITSLPTPELEAREIGREELVVVGRRDDPFMRNDTVAAEELRNRQLIAAAGCEMIIDRIIHGDGETRSGNGAAWHRHHAPVGNQPAGRRSAWIARAPSQSANFPHGLYRLSGRQPGQASDRSVLRCGPASQRPRGIRNSNISYLAYPWRSSRPGMQ